MNQPDENQTAVPCPKCGTPMALATTIPHALDVPMARHTFVCPNCNETRIYMLPSK